ncbi:hypothetical protein ASF53_13545 [Methylobacterium sp. Leaf123]|nr:hypothetical protein ASF53_13545 [Methylobacterium sp. Leaf123]
MKVASVAVRIMAIRYARAPNLYDLVDEPPLQDQADRFAHHARPGNGHYVRYEVEFIVVGVSAKPFLQHASLADDDLRLGVGGCETHQDIDTRSE